MNRFFIATILIVASAFGARPPAEPATQLDAVLNHIDKAGAAFRGMSAKLRRKTHTAVINEDNLDSGTVLLKRAHPKDLRMLIAFTEPDIKSFEFSGHEVQIYYPKMQTVQIFDVGKSKALLEQFFLLGFGTSRTDLLANYSVRLVGEDTIDGQKTQRLELIPKSKEVLQHLVKLEMSVAENGYPLQQKFYLKGGDYQLATYSDMKINPDLPDSALKLKLPKNTKREYPQK